MLASSACFYGLIQLFFFVFFLAASPVFSGTEDEFINLFLRRTENEANITGREEGRQLLLKDD